MRTEFNELRLTQIERSLQPFYAARGVTRPAKGWLRAIRRAERVTLAEMAEKLGTTPQACQLLEQSEADLRITMKSLRSAAEVLGCELVYALVPREGNIGDIIERKAHARAEESVRAVQHTMALEDQAVRDLNPAIEQETRRLLQKKGAR